MNSPEEEEKNDIEPGMLYFVHNISANNRKQHARIVISDVISRKPIGDVMRMLECVGIKERSRSSAKAYFTLNSGWKP